MASVEPTFPTWVVPAALAVRDLHVVAVAVARNGQARAAGCVDALDRLRAQPDASFDEAGERFAAATAERADPRRDGESCTLAWLMGLAGQPPLELPRRGADGAVVTAEELYRERAAEAVISWAPEERRQERARAERDSARWSRLADLR